MANLINKIFNIINLNIIKLPLKPTVQNYTSIMTLGSSSGHLFYTKSFILKKYARIPDKK